MEIDCEKAASGGAAFCCFRWLVPVGGSPVFNRSDFAGVLGVRESGVDRCMYRVDVL